VTLPSNTKLDQLGDRLRRGQVTDDDLRLLDAFRRSFSDGYENVIAAVKRTIQAEPTGRPAKSTTSIIENLQRETIRLTQIQDIAGCRLVGDARQQQNVIEQLRALFPEGSIVDRRRQPSHGYRAIHVIVTADGKPIEIQVRTTLQHLWAEFSEKMGDVIDPAIKYGGGPSDRRDLLRVYSELVSEIEEVELAPGNIDHVRLDSIRQQLRDLLEGEIAGMY
jgi:putative GTP pyrophosphokinase